MKQHNACPFCHSDHIGILQYQTRPAYFAVTCYECHARGPSCLTMAEARQGWGNRQGQPRRCGCCGTTFWPSRTDRLYCSRRCTNRVSHDRWAERQKAVILAEAWEEVLR